MLRAIPLNLSKFAVFFPPVGLTLFFSDKIGSVGRSGQKVLEKKSDLLSFVSGSSITWKEACATSQQGSLIIYLQQ